MKRLLATALLALSSIAGAQDIILRGMCVSSVEGEIITLTPCAKKKSNLLIGDPSWINPANLHAGWSGAPEDYTEIVGAGDGRNAGLFATRTSDVGEDSMYWTLGAIANNDNARAQTYSYGVYVEGFMQASAHPDSFVHGMEIDIVNRRPFTAQSDPFNVNAAGLTEGARLVAGDLGGEVAYDVSHALALVSNPGDQTPRFLNGIVVAHDAIKPGGSVLMLPEGVGISWYSGPGKRSAFITVIDGKLVVK